MERLKSFADLEMVPVIVITARSEAEGEKAVALGARRFFQKPFDSDELLSEIRQALGR